MTPERSAVDRAVAEAHRREWASVLAAAVRVARDLDLAEDCAQEAFARALQVWPRDGIPARPGAWLTTVARNRATDQIRRESVWRRALPQLVVAEQPTAVEDSVDLFAGPDDQLRLIFTCCHPALSDEAQIALTLRLVCGLSTADVARAFLVQESTMAARITRAKKKIAKARIPYRIPSGDELPGRVAAVCEVLHLVFTTGHAAPTGDSLLRGDLIEAAIRHTRTLHRFLPRDGTVSGLLALMLLTDARRDARVSPSGRPILLPDQDRTRWDQAQIAEGRSLTTRTLSHGPPNPYAVEAAIAAVHAEASTWADTDWAEIVGLYDVLMGLRPSPVVAFNRAVAVGFRDGPQAGLDALQPLQDEPALATYSYFCVARADYLFRVGRRSEARDAYEEALAMTTNEAERAFLSQQLDEATRPEE